MTASPRKLLLTGPPASGKSTRLREWFRVLAQSGRRTDQVLVLVTHTPRALEFKARLGLESSGAIHALSYFGFAQRELRLFWDLVQPRLPRGGTAAAEPLFLNLEQAQYLMLTCLRDRRADGPLRHITATDQRLAILLTGNVLTVAAGNGLPHDQIGARLTAADGGDPGGVYAALQDLIHLYRGHCLAGRCLDYALTLELYGQLRQDPLYRRHLLGRVRHLIADDLDESLPVEQDFVADLLPDLDSAVLAMDPEGGHAAFRGADPELAHATFAGACDQEQLGPARAGSPAAAALGDALARRLEGRLEELPPLADFAVRRVQTELRADALDAAAGAVTGWLRQGAPPEQVAVIAPVVDPVLLARLSEAVAPLGVRVDDLTRSRRLLDDPYARALVCLIQLVHPDWEPRPPAGLLAGALGLLLQVDAVRAGLLARAIERAGDLPDLEEARLRRRIGFAPGERYTGLRHWVLQRRAEPRPIDEFCELAASQQLVPLLSGTAGWASCRQVVESAHRFSTLHRRVGLLQDAPAGARFMDMLLTGTLAAELLEPPGTDPGAVLVSTPYAFLTSRRSVQHQVWLDVLSDSWLRSDAKEVANPHVLARRWPPGEQWTGAADLLARRRNGARTVRGLMRRAERSLTLIGSELNGWGFEEGGGLGPALAGLPLEGGDGR